MGVDYRFQMIKAVVKTFLARGDPIPGSEVLDPPVRALLRQVSQAQALLHSVEPLTEEKIVFGRSLMERVAKRQRFPAADGVVVEDLVIPGVDGPIPARLYHPDGDGPFPLHVYFHGGAFLFGKATDPETDSYLRWRSQAAGVIIVNPDYRLAPEHRFPAGVEDCYTTVSWAVSHAAELGGDPTRVSVGGTSSGGNMAAAVALMSRDRGGPALNLQLLEIPGTDLTKNSDAWRDPDSLKDTTREADLALIGFYLAEPGQIVHPYASPLLAPTLDGVAPAYVMSAEFDPRREESEAYVARLNDMGVRATARMMTGHVHGSYALWPQWEPARAWRDEANTVLRKVNETGAWD